MAQKDFKAAMTAINNGKNYPAVSLVKTNPEVAAMISKLVDARQRPLHDNRGNRTLDQTNRGNFEKISQEITEKSQDSESIMQLFPEMELAAQILVSSIISPKDMSGGEVIVTAPQGALTPEVIAMLINKLREHFDHNYKLKPLIPKILRDILFESGSYPIAVIPESSIDDLINGTSNISKEGLASYVAEDGVPKNYNILGNPDSNKKTARQQRPFALEAFSEYKVEATYCPKLTGVSNDKRETIPDSMVRIVDNPYVLRFPELIKKVNSSKIKNLFSKKTGSVTRLGNEAFNTKLNDAQMQALVYKSRARTTTNVVKIKTADQASRQTIGAPLVMRLPSESVIPVHVPGNEEQHIGYFVLIDAEGNPINKNSSVNQFGDLQIKLNGIAGGGNGGNSMSSYLQSKANASMGVGGGGTNMMNVETATKIYTDIVESDLLERLRNGVYGNNVCVARNSEVYRIMLGRALSNQLTQLLYLPGELVTYFAYKYDSNGVGKSLLDDMRILNSLRAMMMFSRVMASIKNSIGRTGVELNLDPEDPDPNKTIEIAMHEIAKTRQQFFPLGVNQASDLVDWVQRGGYEYSFKGHPKIPEMSLEFSEKSSANAKPDTELDDDLKKRSIMGVGLSPETVDNAFSSEFATTVVSNNLLLSKRVSQIQDHFTPLLTDHARKYVTNHGFLMTEIKDILDQNYDKFQSGIEHDENLKTADKEGVIEYLSIWFANAFEISLPQPDSITLEAQMKSFDIYQEGLEKAIDAYINDELMTSDMAGNISSNVSSIKAIVKAYFLRKWMADNNVFTELADITSAGENDKPMLDFFNLQNDHIKGLIRSSTRLFKSVKDMGKAADKDIDVITGGQGLDESTSSDTGDVLGDDGLGEMPSFDDPTDIGGDDEDEQDPTTPAESLPKIEDDEK